MLSRIIERRTTPGLQEGYMNIQRRIGAVALAIAASLSSVAQQEAVFRTSDSPEGPQPWTHLNFYNDPMNFKFVVMTDRSGGVRPGVFKVGAEKVNLLMPEFVMCVGDLIQGGTTDLERLDWEWKDFESELAPLKVPFFFVPGNHDISNDVQRDLWMKRYGRAYHHFVYKDVLFLQLDSTNDHGEVVTEKQVAYAKEVLEANKDVRWTFVFFHHPMWLYGDTTGFPKIEKLLEGRKHTVIAGHNHRYQYAQREHADYFILATTGGGSQLRGPLFGEFDHVTLITVTDDGPILANLRLEGILPHDVSTPATLEVARDLFESTQFEALLLTQDGQSTDGAEVFFTFTNPGENPLTVWGRFFHGHGVSPEQRQVELTVAPGASEKLRVPVEVVEARDDEPLQFDWTIGYEFEGQEDAVMSGTRPIPVAPADLDLIATKVPKFDAALPVALRDAPSGMTLRYTTDGSEPTFASKAYSGPFELAAAAEVKARAFTADGAMASGVSARDFEKAAPGEGLAYRYFTGAWRFVPDFAAVNPAFSAVATDLDIEQVALSNDDFGVQYLGNVTIPRAGRYTFHLSADDDADLYLDGKLVIDMSEDPVPPVLSASVDLAEGKTPLRIDFVQRGGGKRLSLEIEGPGMERQAVPAAMYSRD